MYSTCEIIWPLILRVSSLLSFFRDDLKSIKWVLARLSDNLLSANQVDINFSSLFI